MSKKRIPLWELQEKYLADRSDTSFQTLFTAVNEFCIVAVKSLCKEYCLSFELSEIEEKALDAAIRFCGLYQKHNNYRIKQEGAFPNRLRTECRGILFRDADKEIFKSKEITIDENDSNEYAYEDTHSILENEQEIVDLSDAAKSFEEFIQQVAEVRSQDYCYANIKKLMKIFRQSGETGNRYIKLKINL